MGSFNGEGLSDQVKVRLEKLNTLKQQGQNPFNKTKFEVSSNSETIRGNFEKLESTEVKVAGRIMSKRVMGKISFAGLQDGCGQIQCYIKK